MPQKYRVVIIVPPGYRHSSAFLEVAFLLKSTLNDLRNDCDIGFNELSPGVTNILLGGHLLQWSQRLADCRYIPYQLEQLSADEGPFSENLQKILAGAAAVWDYSRENVDFLGQRGIRAVHLPIGYHPYLEQIPHALDKDIDVLFYGSVGERRKKVLDALAAVPGMRVQALFGVYGKPRDEMIGRARILLNVHHYSTKIFEAVRVSYLLNNRCFVVSEESSVYPYPGVDVCRVPYDRLVETCRDYLSRPSEIELARERTYQQFRKLYAMREMLGRTIVRGT